MRLQHPLTGDFVFNQEIVLLCLPSLDRFCLHLRVYVTKNHQKDNENINLRVVLAKTMAYGPTLLTGNVWVQRNKGFFNADQINVARLQKPEQIINGETILLKNGYEEVDEEDGHEKHVGAQ